MEALFFGFLDWVVKGAIVGILVFVWLVFNALHNIEKARLVAQSESKAEKEKMDAILKKIEKFMEDNANTDMRITQAEKDIVWLRAHMLSIETLKRVEIYMELIFAKNGIDQKIDLTSHNRKTDLEL